MANLRKTKEPGILVDMTSGDLVELADFRVDDRYDTQVTASGAVAANTKERFFNTLTDKEPIDANFPDVNRICGAGEEMEVERFWIAFPQATGNTRVPPRDIIKAAEGLYIVWKLNRALVSEGAAVKYAPGFGVSGQTNENNTGVVNNGIASPATVSRLDHTFLTGERTQIFVEGQWYDHVWDATNMPTLDGKVWTRAGFHGVIKDAAIKNT